MGTVGGDPINRIDLTGHIFNLSNFFRRLAARERQTTVSNGLRSGEPTVSVIAISEPPTYQASQQAQYGKNIYHTKDTQYSEAYDHAYENYKRLERKVELADMKVSNQLARGEVPSYSFIEKRDKLNKIFDDVEGVVFSEKSPPPSYHLAESLPFPSTSNPVAQVRNIRQEPLIGSWRDIDRT